MAALVELVPVLDVRVALFGPPTRAADDLLGVDRATGRDLDPTAAEVGEALPVQTGRRRTGRGEPVDRDVVEDLVPGQRRLRVPVVVGPGPHLLGDPCALAGGRIDQAVAERLGPGRLLLRVARIPSVVVAETLERRRLLRGRIGQGLRRRTGDRHVGVDRPGVAQVLHADVGGDRTTPVTALGDIGVIAEPDHQRVPRGRDPRDTLAGRGRLAAPPVAGQ